MMACMTCEVDNMDENLINFHIFIIFNSFIFSVMRSSL